MGDMVESIIRSEDDQAQIALDILEVQQSVLLSTLLQGNRCPLSSSRRGGGSCAEACNTSPAPRHTPTKFDGMVTPSETAAVGVPCQQDLTIKDDETAKDQL